jgi:hypothetical protein
MGLTQYDERGWRVLAYQRDGHWVGANAVARDAAGGVGGVGRRGSEARCGVRMT